MSKPKQLWLRMGDDDGYETFDDLGTVAEVIRTNAGDLTNVAMIAGGFEADGYRGANYISLYWGDEKANLERSLTRKEFIGLIDDVNPEIFARDRMNEMPSPDGQGSEYRCVYEFVSDLVDQTDADNNFALISISDSLDEIIAACRMFKKKFKKPY